MSYTLIRPRTAIVEAEGLSGQTASGIYVLDHYDTKNMHGDAISLLYRVLETTPDCRDLKPGAVYQVANPYAFTLIDHNGEQARVMHEDNFICELEGYDEDERFYAQQTEDSVDAFPVCGK